MHRVRYYASVGYYYDMETRGYVFMDNSKFVVDLFEVGRLSVKNNRVYI